MGRNPKRTEGRLFCHNSSGAQDEKKKIKSIVSIQNGFDKNHRIYNEPCLKHMGLNFFSHEMKFACRQLQAMIQSFKDVGAGSLLAFAL